MEQPIIMQSFSRSQLDRSRICTFDQETAACPTQPLIHQDARFLLIRSGCGELRIQGARYALAPDRMIAILPWQVSEITRVDEPLQYYLIAYHYDTISAAIHLFLDAQGQPPALQSRIEQSPAVTLRGLALRDAQYLTERLRAELGVESVLNAQTPQPFSSVQTVSLLTQLLVLFLREQSSGEAPTGEADYRELLRYIYLHCNSRLTLQALAGQFYCSRSTISAHISAMTGMSFSDLLNEMRIGKTANYLLYTDMTLKEMAEVLGYVDESHISKVFAARLGTKISEYRKTYQRVENICRIEQSRMGYSLVNYIYRNYASELTAKSVAQVFGISVTRLNQLLLYQVEQNFEDLLSCVRVNRACELLLTTRKTVLEIALEVGFHTSKTLTRSFLRHRQTTPSAFRAARACPRPEDTALAAPEG